VRIISGNTAKIHHNTIRDGWMGIMIVSGHSHEIYNNTIHNFGTQNTSPENGSGFGIYNNSPGGSSYSQAIKIYDNDIYNAGGDSYQAEGASQSYVELYRNLMHNNGEDGIDLKNAQYHRIYDNSLYNNNGDGLVTHANLTSNYIEFYRNRVYDNGWWGVYFVSGTGHQVYNNLIYGNAKDNSTYQTRGLRVTGTACTVYHNTLYDNGAGRAGLYTTGCTVQNNALYQNGVGNEGNIRSSSTGTISVNYVSPPTPGLTGTNAITSSVPGFASVATGNFTLVAGSVLINAGAPGTGVTTDFAGTARDASPDIGAYEAGGAPPPPPTPDTTAPVLSGIVVSPVTATTAQICWDTDESSTTQIHYGTVSGTLGSSTTISQNLITAHCQTLSGLSASTTYYYQVESTDASSNTATSTEGNFATAAAPAAPDFPTTGVLDTANRANEGPPPSASWADALGFGFGVVVNTNQFAGGSSSPTGGTNASYWSVETFGPEAEVVATIATKANNQTIGLGLRLQQVGSANIDGYRCIFTPLAGTDSFAIQRVDNGTSTTLTSIAQEASNADPFGCEAIGTTITLYANLSGAGYAALGSVTDSTYPGAGYIGMDIVGTTIRADEFGGGTRNEEADTTAPVISSITVTNITETTATVNWTTDEPATTQIDYGETAGYGSSTTLAAALVTSHSQTITGLTAETTYHYSVLSTDAYGNSDGSTDATFATLATPGDTTAPVVSAVATTGVTHQAATITWTTDEAGSSQVLYGLTTGYGSATTLDATEVTSHSVALAGLAADTAYFFQVRTCDTAGNCGTDTSSLRTTVAPDTTAPTISTVTVDALGTTTAVVSETATEPSIARIAYGLTTNYGSTTPWDYPHQLAHTILLRGLADNTTYHYRVEVCDPSNNCTTGIDRTLTTLAAPATPRLTVDTRATTTPRATVARTTTSLTRQVVER